MSLCFVCHKPMPEKSLGELVDSMQVYRERFDDWAEETPVLVCADCDEDIKAGAV